MIEGAMDWELMAGRLQKELDAANGRIEALEEVRSAGCQCGDDDACRFVRERDAAEAEVARLREGIAFTERLIPHSGVCPYCKSTRSKLRELLKGGE